MQGGVGAFTQELAREMSRAGHELHVITSREADPDRNVRRRLSFSAVGEPIQSDQVLLHPWARRWRWGDINAIADIAIRFDLDIINIQYQPAAFNMRSPAINIAPWRLRGILPTVVTFHDLRAPYLFPKAGPLRRWVVFRMAAMAQGVIATNEADGNMLEQKGIHSRRIPIGSNIAVHQVSARRVTNVRASLDVGPADCLLAYFGFLNESKGAETLVRALTGLDGRFRLVFVGGNTGASDPTNQAYFRHITDLINALKLDDVVHWTEFLPDEDVSAHLLAADMVVMPYQDGVSLRRGTLMAALAHGRPVISTFPPAPIPQLVHGENIWLVPAGDPAALAGAIQTLAGNPALAARLATNARKRAEWFSWPRIARLTLAYYEELLLRRTR